MKEIRMDFETYETEIRAIRKEAKEAGCFFVLYKLSQWLKGEISLDECLSFDESTNRQINRILSILEKKYDLKNNERNPFIKEIAV